MNALEQAGLMVACIAAYAFLGLTTLVVATVVYTHPKPPKRRLYGEEKQQDVETFNVVSAGLVAVFWPGAVVGLLAIVVVRVVFTRINRRLRNVIRRFNPHFNDWKPL